jgi:hypothetical protein
LALRQNKTANVCFSASIYSYYTILCSVDLCLYIHIKTHRTRQVSEIFPVAPGSMYTRAHSFSTEGLTL